MFKRYRLSKLEIKKTSPPHGLSLISDNILYLIFDFISNHGYTVIDVVDKFGTTISTRMVYCNTGINNISVASVRFNKVVEKLPLRYFNINNFSFYMKRHKIRTCHIRPQNSIYKTNVVVKTIRLIYTDYVNIKTSSNPKTREREQEQEQEEAKLINTFNYLYKFFSIITVNENTTLILPDIILPDKPKFVVFQQYRDYISSYLKIFKVLNNSVHLNLPMIILPRFDHLPSLARLLVSKECSDILGIFNLPEKKAKRPRVISSDYSTNPTALSSSTKVWNCIRCNHEISWSKNLGIKCNASKCIDDYRTCWKCSREQITYNNLAYECDGGVKLNDLPLWEHMIYRTRYCFGKHDQSFIHNKYEPEPYYHLFCW
jgi:hypothetical protein